MNKIEQIRNHPLFLQEYDRLQRMEAGRTYCGHDMEHFLDVARVCWIQTLEQNLPLTKDIVYAAGLLHDIGKGLQYEQGTPHHIASAQLAEKILPECGYTPEEITPVVEAIKLHRKPQEHDHPLVTLLYFADKKTRLCFCCKAAAECNWSDEKRTKEIAY